MSEMDKDILISEDKKTKTNKETTKKNKSNDSQKTTSSTYTKKRKRKRRNSNTKKDNISKSTITKTNTNKKEVQNIKKKTPTKKELQNEKEKTTNKKEPKKEKELQRKKEITKKTLSSRKKRSKKSTSKNNKKLVAIFILVLILILFLLITSYKINYDKQLQESKDNKLQDIMNHYNEYVITNKETNIYKLKNNKYIISGTITANQELTLASSEISYEDEYLKLTTFDEEYYIYYKDIDTISELSKNNDRYKKYIVFNKNIVTNDETSFYDSDNNLVYKFNKSYELPIIINKENIYGVEFNNRLLYVKKEDVKEIINHSNTELTNTSGIAVLNYHFFYDETKESERNDCNQIICHSKSGFTKHLQYIKNNNIFTTTMEEFEMYLNKEINLPKSVLITIDDGWRTEVGKELLQEYELNATIFLITSWFKEIKGLNSSEYIEYHSHGDNLHNQGVCPGGQGGAIKCQEKTALLKDLALSREKLGGTTAFCYPFYEYNSYSISVLKEAGFTLAFAGGFKKATPDTDKYQIPRYVMYDYTTVSELANYIN